MYHIDLFTGIGGFALGLEGISTPCLYCDNNAFCIKVLQDRIAKGCLPDAPFAKDVESVIQTSILPNHKPDLIVGSFPCVGMSTAGKRQGFQEKQTGLFHELLRVIDIFKTPLIFMENVANILAIGMKDVVDELATKRGYELRWVTMPAYAVGLPHMRKRWYCLAVRTDSNYSYSQPLQDFKYPVGVEPARMIMEKSPYNNEVLRVLGNALIPACARLAFTMLFSNFQCNQLTGCPTLTFAHVDTSLLPPAKPGLFPPSGIHANHTTFRLPQPCFSKPNLGLLLLGRPLPPVVSPRLSSAIITTAKLALWATPRSNSISCCNVLTMRSARDLATQLKFEANTVESFRNGKPNPMWVQWLMGFPGGWLV